MAPDSRPELHFGYAATAPSLDRLDVKRIAPGDLLGTPSAFAVIGESHYVAVPDLGFHEVCSCKPIPAETTCTVALTRGVTREFAFDTDTVTVETTVTVDPFDSFPGPENADVTYRFGADAWTTIAVSDAGYETYHTYPEYDTAVYTETQLTPTANTTTNNEP